MDRRHGYYGRWGLGAVAAGALVLAGAVFTHADVPPQRLKTGLSCGDCTPTRESIRDPLAPSRTLKLLGKRASKGLEAPMTNDDSWVTARPTTEQRKPTHAVDVPGRNPCEPEDPGDGIFTDWRSVEGWDDMGFPVAEVAAFLEAGSAAGLDTACLSEIQPPPFFVSPAGPLP